MHQGQFGDEEMRQLGFLQGNLRALLIGLLAFCQLNIVSSSYSAVLSSIREDLLLSYTLSGFLMSSYFVGYALGQLPWGYFADRSGSGRAMALSVFGCSISTVFLGLSSTSLQAILSRFLAGLLGAGVFVPGVRLISSLFPAEKRGRALGFFSIGGSVGLILASWVTPLMSVSVGWKTSMMIYGLVGCAIAVAIWRMLPHEDQIRTSAEPVEERVSSRQTYDTSFWVLALVQFVRLGSNYTFIAWMPLVLQEEYGLNVLAAGLMLSLFNLAGLVSNPLGGLFSDRLGEKSLIAVSFFALALNLLVFVYIHAIIGVALAIFLLGWFVNFVRSPSFTIIPKLYGAKRAGKMSGIENTFASIGSLVLPLLLGYVRDMASSYYVGWMSLLLLVLISASTCFLLEVPR